MNRTAQFCAAAALALALSTTSFADPPAGKGKDQGAQGQEQGHSQGNSDAHDKNAAADDSYGRYGEDQKGNADNHGQVVSECNHRANERNLKGQDRKEWTEWCEERGSRHNYDYQRYNTDRTCYQKADKKGLSGDKRRKYLNDCLGR